MANEVTGKPGLDWYVVNEIFTSVQGEGVLAGTPCTFIRLQGCPVGCEWCDSGPLADLVEGRMTNGMTRNTWGAGGTKMSVDQILEQVVHKHVVITGGEPTIWNLDGLLNWLQPADYYVQLETSGLRELIGNLRPNWITWSPKQRLGWNAPRSIKLGCQEVKWVVDTELTFELVLSRWKELYDLYADNDKLQWLPKHVLMPEGSPPKPENIKKALAWLDILPEGFRFGDRLQYRLGLR